MWKNKTYFHSPSVFIFHLPSPGVTQVVVLGGSLGVFCLRREDLWGSGLYCFPQSTGHYIGSRAHADYMTLMSGMKIITLVILIVGKENIFDMIWNVEYLVRGLHMFSDAKVQLSLEDIYVIIFNDYSYTTPNTHVLHWCITGWCFSTHHDWDKANSLSVLCLLLQNPSIH